AIEAALKLHLPILGICRGLQAVNVALGGSLIVDLPQAGITGHGKTNGGDSFHQVSIVAKSLLSDALTREDVNSSHHQAVDQPAPTLRVTARAPDGVVEAMEWMDAAGNGFLLLVQWHPERLESRATLSRLPGRLFIDAVSAFWQAA
ncbi:MAG: gamma-glutamyl-gamma-aminobutyrate hydrolase family protein, partial [Chlorobi bacterium]|nr:gamma-glutamyl-gamma-aminobutyrate hydrolase family protein [Chlorobiota bacterium]